MPCGERFSIERVTIDKIDEKGVGAAIGTVELEDTNEGLRIVPDLKGLPPGPHGFHVHEFGDCSSPEAKSAGSHFNPTKAKHAGHDAKQRHVGDLGNIEANAQGTATIDMIDNLISFHGAHSIIGRLTPRYTRSSSPGREGPESLRRSSSSSAPAATTAA